MDTRSELTWERATLVKADRDIAQGKERIGRQVDLVDALRGRGEDTREAERLLGLLRDTLAHWERHRTLILQRIDDLAARIDPP